MKEGGGGSLFAGARRCTLLLLTDEDAQVARLKQRADLSVRSNEEHLHPRGDEEHLPTHPPAQRPGVVAAQQVAHHAGHAVVALGGPRGVRRGLVSGQDRRLRRWPRR